MADTTTKKENDQPETEWKEVGLHADNTRDEEEKLRKEKLGRKDMVNVIAQAIMEVEPPFTFGIYGSWGSGKTYFMESVMERLEKPDKDNDWEPDPKPTIVFFEAWRHQRDEHPEISMLGALRGASYKKNKRKKLIANGLDAVIGTLEAILETRVAVIGKIRSAIARRKEIRFDTAEWQVRLSREFKKTSNKITKSAKRAKGVKNSPRIVFFIDDLDRCVDENVIAMLEKIKLFFWHRHCVFVLGAAPDIMAKIVETKMRVPDGNSYLEKIVNFPFYLPPISDGSNSKFFEDIIDGEHAKAVIDIFKAASDSARANPRKMILLANSYKMNRYLTQKAIEAFYEEKKKENPSISKEDYKQDERITAILTALQTLHVDAFNKIFAGRKDRDANLDAFFSVAKEPSETSSRGRIEERLADISEPDVVNTIRTQIPDDLVRGSVPLRLYVEFLASQSEAKQGFESRGDNPWIYDRSTIRKYNRGDISSTVKWIQEHSTFDDDVSSGVVDSNRLVVIGEYLWRVLDVDKTNNKALLLSERITHAKPYNEEYAEITWENCTLRAWLNGRFLDESFTEEEREKIQDTTIDNADNKWYGTAGGNNIEDKIFLLSIAEVVQYFGDSGQLEKQPPITQFEKKQKWPTEYPEMYPKRLSIYIDDQYNKARQAKLPDGETAGWWWLRSPGYNSLGAALVIRDGNVFVRGNYVLDARISGGVRPAFWLDLKS
jgi:hypothetical protein